MAIPQNDYLEAPFDDELMVYDYKEHRYIPRVDGVTKNGYVDLVIDWGSKENAQSYLDLVSRVIYQTILSHKDGTKYTNTMLYYLSHSKMARNWLMQLFLDNVWYNRRDGGFMLAYNSGANLNAGKKIEFTIKDAQSPIAEQIVFNSGFASRILKYNINTMTYFNDFDALKDFLLEKGIITQSQYEKAENLKDLKFISEYRFFINDDNKYVMEDLKTYKKVIAKMKIYDPNGGDW